MPAPKQMIALDVGARSVRAVWVSLRGGQPVVTRAETFALPMDEENPHELISTWVASVGLSKQFCAIALPGAQTVFQSGRIMPNDPRTPEQVAAMDIAQFNEMAGDDMFHDVTAFETPFEAGVRRYVMSMARPAAIAEAIQATRLNHLRPADLIAAPVALYNAMEALSDNHEEVRCYVNIGHTQTEIAVGLDAGILFARSFAAGGKLFTDAVAQVTGLPTVQAEVRKHADCGLRENDACFENLRVTADRWIAQFNASLGVYRSTFQDRKFQISKIVISGGGSQLKGLKEYLAAKLFVPVLTPAELDNVPVTYKQYVGTYDLAFGLAISAMGLGMAQLSLLPSDLKDEVIFCTKKPWWVATAIFFIGAMALYSATGIFMLKRDGELLDTERDKLAQRERTDKRIQDLRLMQSQVLTNSLPLSDLLYNGPLSREVLSLVSQTVDPEDWITLFCDEKIYNPQEQTEAKADTPQAAVRNPFSLFRTVRPAAPAANAGTPANPRHDPAARKDLVDALSATTNSASVFIVEGYTANPSLKSVREMISRLKTSPEIVRADLRRDDQVLAPTGIPELEGEKLPSFRRFVIEIEVKRP